MDYHIGSLTICDICFDYVLNSELNNHKIKCKQDQINMFKKYSIGNQKPPLTSVQGEAILYAGKKSKIISKNVYLMVLAKYKFLGYTEDDLKTTVNYIQEKAPVIIHLNLDRVIKFLCNDTEYRNQFETGTSGGSLSHELRLKWEKTLFNGIYDKSKGYEKVKYGVLNITNNPEGTKSCYTYGDSYLVLKSEIKKRTTFVHGDSSRQDLHIVTFSYPVPILNFLDNCNNFKSKKGNRELTDVIDVATGRKQFTESHKYYIEAQIHGPVHLNTDIDVLMVNKRHKGDDYMLELLEEFSYEHNCKYQFIE